jgi:hypothetical protein
MTWRDFEDRYRWLRQGKLLMVIKVTTPKTNSYPSLTAKKATVKASQWTQVKENMFSIPTQGFKSNQWQLRSTLRQPMGGGAFCTWGCSIKHKSSVICRLFYDINLKNLYGVGYSQGLQKLQNLFHSIPLSFANRHAYNFFAPPPPM